MAFATNNGERTLCCRTMQKKNSVKIIARSYFMKKTNFLSQTETKMLETCLSMREAKIGTSPIKVLYF
jgi:hypothetical protein